jgi:hypothetical protein
MFPAMWQTKFFGALMLTPLQESGIFMKIKMTIKIKNKLKHRLNHLPGRRFFSPERAGRLSLLWGALPILFIKRE